MLELRFTNPTTQARYYFIQHFGNLQAGEMIETIFEHHRANGFDDYLLLYADTAISVQIISYLVECRTRIIQLYQ